MNENFGVFPTIHGPRAIFNGSWTQAAEAFLEEGQHKAADFSGHLGDLSFFERCGSSLVDVSIDNDDKLLYGARFLENLEKLSLGFKNKDRFSFLDLPKLTELEFTWQSKDKCHTALSHPTIKHLRIDKASIDTPFANNMIESVLLYSPVLSNLGFLNGCGRLESLRVESARKLTAIESLPSTLKELDLRYCGKVSDFRGLKTLNGLESIYFLKSCQSDSVPEEIYSLPTLRKVQILASPLNIDWERILSMRSLEKVALVDANPVLTDDDLKVMARNNGKEPVTIKRQGKKLPLVIMDFLDESRDQ